MIRISNKELFERLVQLEAKVDIATSPKLMRRAVMFQGVLFFLTLVNLILLILHSIGLL